jgi:dTDP-4-dehydrorhamnose reductase
VKVAVTGANGLLGGEAVLRLCGLAAPAEAAPGPGARGPGSGGAPEVLALGRGPCRLPPGPYQYRQADLGSGELERVLLEARPTHVLHCGAATDVDGCERDPLLAWRANVEGTAEAARACRALGARLVAVSTDYVFDGEAGPYAEDDRPNPRGAYARSKRCGEEAALLLSPGCAVARVAVVYSGRPGAKPTFATQVVEKLTRGEPVKAFADQHVSTTLAASGAAMCLELLLETAYAGVLHVCDQGVLDRVAFAIAVARRFGLSGEIVPVKTADVKLPAPRPLRAGLKVDRAAALLRNKPLPLDEALDRFWAEWQLRTAART